jgi:hypothetical protein
LIQLSLAEARAIAVAAQGLHGTDIAPATVRGSRGITRLEGFQVRPGQDTASLPAAVHTVAAWAGSHAIDARPLCPPRCELTES